MIKPLSYWRKLLYRTSVLTGTTLTEGAIYHVPDFIFQYHVFLIKNGIEQKKGYRKTYAGAKCVLERFLKGARKYD